MVQGNKFHGLPMENPIDHLDQFDRLCGTVKINGVSEDALKLRLFPFSLGDKAQQWEKGLPPGSILTWGQCKKTFLAKYFSSSRTARLRNEISSYVQKGSESFGETWERYKGYLSQCPHHGFSEESLLSTFYRGLLPKYRELLDTACNGNFLGQDAEHGMTLVENMAQSDTNCGGDYDRRDRSMANDGDDRMRLDMRTLNEKLDKVLQVTRRHVHFVDELDAVKVQADGEAREDQEEVSFVGNFRQGGFNPNYRNHPNLSYRSNNVENPQDQTYPPMRTAAPSFQQGGFRPTSQFNKPSFTPQQYQGQGGTSQQPKEEKYEGMLRSILEGQTKASAEISEGFKNVHRRCNELNNKFDGLASRINVLETQTAQLASSSQRPHGMLPGKSEMNPKEFVNVITLKSIIRREGEPTEKDRIKEIGPQNRPVGVDVDSAEIPEAKIGGENRPVLVDVEPIGQAHRPVRVDALPTGQSHREVLVDSSPEQNSGGAHRPNKVDSRVLGFPRWTDWTDVAASSSSRPPHRPITMDGHCARRHHRSIMIDPRSDNTMGTSLTTYRRRNHSQGSDGPDYEIIRSCNSITQQRRTKFIEPANKKRFEEIVKSIPESFSFKDAWKRYSLRECFVGTDETIYDAEKLFRRVRSSANPYLSHPLSPTNIIDVAWFFKKINAEKLRMFRRLVLSLPKDYTFEEALFKYNLDLYFTDTKETIKEIEELFIDTQLKGPIKTICKRKDSGQYKVNCSIFGRTFNALCDSGASINVMSAEQAKSLGVHGLKKSNVRIGLADAHEMRSYGVAENVIVWIDNCRIPTDFHVVDIKGDDHTQLILGRPFLATVGAVIDWPNQRISFTYVNRDVFYKATPAEGTPRSRSRRSSFGGKPEIDEYTPAGERSHHQSNTETSFSKEHHATAQPSSPQSNHSTRSSSPRR